MPKEAFAKTGASAAYEVILELEESLDRSQMSSFDGGFPEKMPFLLCCRPSRRNYEVRFVVVSLTNMEQLSHFQSHQQRKHSFLPRS